MFLSRYSLGIMDLRKLRLDSNAYAVHRMIYGMFENDRNGDAQRSSGILYADKGIVDNRRLFLILSNREPLDIECGRLLTKEIPDRFYAYDQYRFQVAVNPVVRGQETGRRTVIKDREAACNWFLAKSERSGFAVAEETLTLQGIEVDKMEKSSEMCFYISRFLFSGVMTVSDREKFVKTATKGMGHAKAYGCGLLELQPM